MNKRFTVCTRCFTYNHERYIVDALNGFCMQQTAFPVVYCIVDDASTDDTPNLIQEYVCKNFDIANDEAYQEETPDYLLTFAQHKSNNNCYFAVFYLKYNHYQIKKRKVPYLAEWWKNAKYQAVCEGDDYWIDPLKLSKQVEFMQNHPNCSLCITAYNEINPKGGIEIKCKQEDAYKFYEKDYILGNEKGLFFASPSMLHVSNCWERPTWAMNAPIADIPLFLILAEYGDVGCLGDITTCYRCFNTGSWSNRISTDSKFRLDFYKRIIKMWKGYDEWTNKKYHGLVNNKIKSNKKILRHEKLLYLINTVCPGAVELIRNQRKAEKQ